MDETPKWPKGQNDLNDDQLKADGTKTGDQQPPKREKSRESAHNGQAFTDQELKELFKSEAFTRLMTKVKRFIGSRLFDKQQVDEVFQLTMSGAFETLAKGNLNGRPDPYIMQIAHNQLTHEYDRVTKSRKRETSYGVDVNSIEQKTRRTNAEMFEDHVDPEEALLKKEARNEAASIVREAHAILSDNEKEVLSLREVHGYSYKKIGKILGITENYAKLIRHRAGKKTARYILENHYDAVLRRKQRGGKDFR